MPLPPTTAHHDPIPFGAPRNAAVIELPIGQLDAAIASVIATGSGASTTLTAQANAGQKNMVLAARDGWIVGDQFWIGVGGGTYESGVIASGTGSGAGTLVAVANLANTYPIGTPVSKSPIELVDARGGQTTLGARLSLFDRWAYDVRRSPYNAKGDGVTDDRAAIQAALDACRVAGGGTVYMPPGTYLVTVAAMATFAGSYAALVIGANTRLAGAGPAASILKLANSQQGNPDASHVSAVIHNYTVLGGDEQITFSDFGIDGNNVNQTGTHYGIRMLRTRGVRHERVRGVNIRGAGSAGHPNETSAFEFTLGSEATYVDCEAIGTAGSTASGFGANGSTFVNYMRCRARGMSVSMGFTHWYCSRVVHVDCWSYSNTLHGFNTEFSTDVTYANCIGGAQSLQDVGANPAWPFTANQLLGNAGKGFQSLNGTRIRQVGCSGDRNGSYGVLHTNPTDCRVVGGSYCNNGVGGVGFSGGSCLIDPPPVSTGNTSTPYDAGAAGWHGGPGAQVAPALPATTVAYTNDFGMDATVYIRSGTVTAITVNGIATGLTSGAFRVPYKATVTITYSVAPTWSWILG